MDLIDNMDEKYPSEHFTEESIYKCNLVEIFTKIKNVVINVKSSISSLQEIVEDFETRIQSLEGS